MESHVGKTIKRLGAALAVAAVTVAVPAVGLAAKPTGGEHNHFTTAPHPANFCGVPGTAFETVHEHFKLFEGGDMGTFRFWQTFTASATGKSIQSSVAEAAKLSITDNGDGTIALTFRSSGLALQFKILNGPVFKLADGGPIRSAGLFIGEETVDATTGQTLSFEVIAERGSHLLFEGADICGPVIEYLTSPS